MTHTSPSFTITAFQGYHDDAVEGSATTIAGLSTDFGQTPGTIFRVRLVVAETNNAAGSNEDLQWQFSKNSGTWTDIGTTSNDIQTDSSTYVTDGANTTQQIGTGTFVTPNAGFTEDGLAGGGDLDFAGNDETETECVLRIVDATTSTGDTIELRCLIGGVAPAGTPTLPTITVGEARNVTQNPANAGDLSRLEMTENAATVQQLIKRTVPCTTAALEQKFGGFLDEQIDTYIVDGTGTPDDPGADWTNDTNAFDGSTSTYAEQTAGGGALSDYSTTIPATGDTVGRLEARHYAYSTNNYSSISTFFNGHDQYTGPNDNPAFTGAMNPATWTAWYDASPIAPDGGEDFSVPFPRAELASTLGAVFNPFSSSGQTYRAYHTEVRTTTGTAVTGYWDGTVTDPDAAWTNDANANDGSTSTFATCSTNGTTTGQELRIAGNSLAGTTYDGSIYGVYVRWYGQNNEPGADNAALKVEVYEDDGTTALRDVGQWVLPLDNASGWSSWQRLNAHSEGSWTSTNIGNLVFVAYAQNITGAGSVGIARAEICVLHQTRNNQGATVTKTLGRVCNAATQSLVMTENAANIPIDRTINLTDKTASEQLEFTQNAATIERPQTIIGKTSKRAKAWRAPHTSIWDFDANTATYGGDTGHLNMWDGDTGTSYDFGVNPSSWGQGISGIGPTLSPTAVPIKIEARIYISGTANTDGSLWGGWDYGNQRAAWESLERYELYPFMTIPNPAGAGEGWTEWAEMELGFNNYDLSTHNYTNPLTWDMIQNYLTIYPYYPSISNFLAHAVQIRITEAEPTDNVKVGYVDASEGWIDNQGKWKTQSNAWDGSTTTWAESKQGGGNTLLLDENHLRVHGNTLTQGSSEEEVLAVFIRARLRLSWTGTADEVGCEVQPRHPDWSTPLPVKQMYDLGGTGDDLITFCSPNYDPQGVGSANTPCMYEAPGSGTAFWSPWARVDLETMVDTAGSKWRTWEEVQKIGFSIHRGKNDHDGATLEVAKVEVAVIAAPSNADRKGSKTKKDRGVNQDRAGGGDLTSLEMAGTQATVTTAASNRTVTCTTEAISMTESAATVNAELSFTTGTEAISMASTGAVNRGRNKASTTEVLSLADNDSTLNLARGVSGTTEALNLTEQGATINASRVTSGVTEVLSSTSAGTNVETARGVQSGTEALSMASTGAVNRARNKASTTEQITMPGTLATISTSTNLDVTCTTEAITFTETPASVNGTRIAAGTVELTAFVENASTVNTERSVLATTETLALTDNDSTVTRDRAFTSPTEVVSLAEGASAIDRQRGVNAGTEAISLTENTAEITRGANLDVVCSTEAITFAENTAPISADRGVNGSTEVVTFVESAADIARNRTFVAASESILLAEAGANIDAARGIIGVTEALTLTDNDATVDRDRVFTTNTEAITVTENQATVDTAASNNPRNVTCTTETVSFAETAANVNGLRVVGASVELTALAENAASINRTLNLLSSTEELTMRHFPPGQVNRTRRKASLTNVLTMTESAATVSTSTNRIVSASTSLLAMAESAGLANATRDVTSTTEQLNMTSDAAVARVRNVAGVTENVTLSSATAQANRTRLVAGLPEAVLIAESSAQVFRGANLDVTAVTAALLLADNDATVASGRVLSAQTTELSFTESSAPMNRTLVLAASTEAILLSGTSSHVVKTRTGAQPGLMIYVNPDPEVFVVIDERMIQI